MKTMKDLYSEVAKETGISRSHAKMLCPLVIYEFGNKIQDYNSLKKACVNWVKGFILFSGELPGKEE